MSLNTEAIAAEWKSLEQYLNERFQTNEAFRWITKQTGGKLLPAHVCLGMCFASYRTYLHPPLSRTRVNLLARDHAHWSTISFTLK